MSTIKEEIKKIDEKLQKTFEIEDLDEFTRVRRILIRQRYHIVNKCKHKIEDKEKKSNLVTCIHCEQTFWYCPKAPNHVCKYDPVKDPTHDNCVYCKEPEERK